MRNPFIYRRCDTGRYVIGYYDPYRNNKVRFVSTKTKNRIEANKFFDRWKLEHAQMSGRPLRLSDFMVVFFSTSALKRQPSSDSNYRSVSSKLIAFAGDKFLAEYSVLDIDSFLNSWLQKRMKATVHGYRRALGTIFKTAIEYEYLLKNPAVRTRPIRLPEPEPNVLSKSQFKALLRSVDTYENKDFNKRFMNPESRALYKDLFTFAALSGLRQAELFHLRPEDILENGLIRVVSNEEHTTKGKKTRFVELNDELLPIVERRKHLPYLFVGNSSGDKLNGDYITKTLKKFGAHAGIEKIDFKTFRSTFGKWLLDEGVNLKYISQQLGHASIETTERHYAKYITTEPKGWVNRVKL